MAASARLAAQSLSLCRRVDRDGAQMFLSDWRALHRWWQPQRSEADAVRVAEAQSKELGRLSPRRGPELNGVREPLFAAWVTTLCPERDLVNSYRTPILEALDHYRYDRLYYSQFFAREMAAYRLETG